MFKITKTVQFLLYVKVIIYQYMQVKTTHLSVNPTHAFMYIAFYKSKNKHVLQPLGAIYFKNNAKYCTFFVANANLFSFMPARGMPLNA